MAEIFGTDLNDILSGTDAADVIRAYGGDDVIDGGLGADYIYAGQGNDRIVFSSVLSSVPAPTTFGLIDGGEGFDVVDAGQVSPTNLVRTTNNSGHQVLSLRVGTQYFELQNVEEVFLGSGEDFLAPGNILSQIIIHGGGGADSAQIQGAVNFYADSGDDNVLITGSSGGPDVRGLVAGGSGSDTLKLNILFTVDVAAGTATSGYASYNISGFETYTAYAGGGALNGVPFSSTILGSAAGESMNVQDYGGGVNSSGVTFDGRGGDDNLSGSNWADSLRGGDGNDKIDGRGGNDSIEGGSGDDVLNGGYGADVMTGGEGADAYEVDDVNDVIVEAAGQGTDTVFAYIDFTLTENFENLDLSRGSQTYGHGNSVGNQIIGNEQSNSLAGFGGNDRIEGGAGNDIMDGGNGNDVLLGGTGADTMIGGAGDDLYEVDNTGDRVYESASSGVTDNVFSYVDFALPNNVENLVMLYGNQRFGTGNGGNNIIIGNTQSNVIEGGAGYDTLTGGTGSDLFIVRPGFGVDVISDFVAGAGSQDAILFSSSLFTSYAQVMANAAQVGADTWIGDGAGNTVVLTGVTLSSLHADDFGFI